MATTERSNAMPDNELDSLHQQYLGRVFVAERERDIALDALSKASELVADCTGSCPLDYYSSDVEFAAEGRFSPDDCEARCLEHAPSDADGGGQDMSGCWREWFLREVAANATTENVA